MKDGPADVRNFDSLKKMMLKEGSTVVLYYCRNRLKYIRKNYYMHFHLFDFDHSVPILDRYRQEANINLDDYILIQARAKFYA